MCENTRRLIDRKKMLQWTQYILALTGRNWWNILSLYIILCHDIDICHDTVHFLKNHLRNSLWIKYNKILNSILDKWRYFIANTTVRKIQYSEVLLNEQRFWRDSSHVMNSMAQSFTFEKIYILSQFMFIILLKKWGTSCLPILHLGNKGQEHETSSVLNVKPGNREWELSYQKFCSLIDCSTTGASSYLELFLGAVFTKDLILPPGALLNGTKSPKCWVFSEELFTKLQRAAFCKRTLKLREGARLAPLLCMTSCFMNRPTHYCSDWFLTSDQSVSVK